MRTGLLEPYNQAINRGGAGMRLATDEFDYSLDDAKAHSCEEVWDAVIEVNLKGTYLACRHAIGAMERRGGGSIINLSSVMGLVGYARGVGAGLSPYNPSKGGVLQLTRNLAVELAPRGIRVNCINPGFVDTPFTEKLTSDPEVLSALIDLHPIGRLARPEEIASCALFLASDESTFVTGAPLIVDGGYTAQ